MAGSSSRLVGAGLPYLYPSFVGFPMGPSEQLGMIQMVTGGRTEADMDPDLLAPCPTREPGRRVWPAVELGTSYKSTAAFIVPAPEEQCSQTGHPACPPSRPQPGAAAFPPVRASDISHIMARGLRVLCGAAGAPLASTW